MKSDTEPFVEAVTKHLGLADLTLDHNAFGDIGALALSRTVQSHTVLQSISLVHCHMGEGGARRILYSLKRTPLRVVKALDMSDNNLSEALLSELAALLKRNNKQSSRVCTIQ